MRLKLDSRTFRNSGAIYIKMEMMCKVCKRVR